MTRGAQSGRTPLLGVIYNPMLDELFSAKAGGGVHCNGRPIHESLDA